MARREWAAKLIADDTFTVFLDRNNVQVVGKNAAEDRLRKEHARAVRIVKRAKALQFHGLRDTDTNEFLEGYEAACNDILAAIQKGRA